jgi:hypothetical protein
MTSKLVCLSLVAAAVLTACGGGESNSNATGSSKTVNAQTFTGSVCGALKTYLDDLQGFATSVTSAVTANSSPENGKAQLQKFVGDLLTATDTLINQIKSAGTPDVSGGGQVVSTLVAAFEQTKTGIEALKSDVDNLPTDVAGFTAGAAQISTKMSDVFTSAGSGLDKINSTELQAAAATNSTCQSLGA